ncbi:(2Fe-2S)-binding protein [Pseudonocardia xishanensis]|uniref:(2Fe-2S)-binding protein n=1 Tax=Pseudonocardia xishanensis TaxID=630995 RepID=A0ABP8RM16_9PSEU
MTQLHRLVVNGEEIEIAVAGLVPLSTVLRERLGLTATKVACGRGECGACTVLVGGRPRMACATPAALVREPVWTSEGLAAESADLRAEFADRGAFQCGFCTPGQVVHGCAVLRMEADRPVEGRRERVAHALSGNLCRCTGYQAITDSVCRVAETRRTS